MRENTRLYLQGTLTHLEILRREIDTAIAAIQAVLGEGDMLIVQERPRHTRRKVKGDEAQ